MHSFIFEVTGVELQVRTEMHWFNPGRLRAEI